MISTLIEPSHYQIILNNIKSLRLLKNISSKKMAYDIGLNPQAYSKIENGKVINIDKYLNKICKILDIDKHELMKIDKTENFNNNYIISELLKQLDEKQEEYRALMDALDAKDRAKDTLIKIYEETIIDLKNTIKYWHDKYYRIKEKLIETESRLNEMLRNENGYTFTSKAKSSKTLGNVGGGEIISIKKYFFLCSYIL